MKKRKVDDRQIKALADAILSLLEWRQNKMRLKQEARIKRMITRQRNLAGKQRKLFDQ